MAASLQYHGPKPVSVSDFVMARQHLMATKGLNSKKIQDHQQAMQKTSDPQSKAYNRSHIQGHQQDNAKIDQSLQTPTKLKGGTMNTTKKTGSYKGEPNRLGGGGRFKQMVDKGMSPGLVAFIGRKKYGAARMAKMAASGKKG